MIHLGDITKISGYEVPVVDCVIGGSPCQDLSVAGKRAGLAGERSGLFMEQIRLVKEMREQDAERNRADGRADRPVRPRYMVWENVPGAFSSNKGKDFAAVLEETIRIAEPEAPDVPVPPKGWSNAGAIVGDGWSIAWRTHDAQHWGVPQRRKRISLIADFGGKSASEILFECQSLPRNTEPSGEERKRPSEGTQGSTSYAVRIRGGCDGGGKGALVQEEKSGTLGTGNDQTVFCIGSYHSNAWKSDNPHSGVYKAETARTLDALNCGYPACNQGGMAVVAIENYPADSRVKISDKDLCQSLTSRMGTGGGNVPMVMCTDAGMLNVYQEIAPPQLARQYKDPPFINTQKTYCIGNGQETVGALCAADMKGAGSQYVDQGKCVVNQHTVRRLTPLECERLQGFPDGWTDIGEWIDSKGKKHDSSDSARYKALGNSIALPFWRFLCKRISAQYARKATMASLFDGIGGFPLVWEEWNGKGSAVWASEIEEFPIAVTKYHFKENNL